jgi:hypothetical protein
MLTAGQLACAPPKIRAVNNANAIAKIICFISTLVRGFVRRRGVRGVLLIVHPEGVGRDVARLPLGVEAA